MVSFFCIIQILAKDVWLRLDCILVQILKDENLA